MEQCHFCQESTSGSKTFCKHCGGTLNPDPKTIAELDILQKKIQQESLNPKHYLSLGNLYLNNNSITCALAQLHKALALEEDNAEIHLKIGKTNSLLENYQDALAAVKKASELDQANDEASCELARIYSSMEDWDNAIATSTNYLKKKEDPQILLILAKSKKAIGQFDDALVAYEKIYKKKENQEEVLDDLVELYGIQKRYGQLPGISENLFEIRKDEESLLTLVKAYVLSKTPQKAIDLISKSETQTKKNSFDFFLAVAYLSLDDREKATPLFNHAVLRNIEITDNERIFCTDLLAQVGDSEKEKSNLRETIKWYSIAFKLDSKNKIIGNKLSETHILYGDEYLQNNTFDSAKFHFQQAVEILNSMNIDSSDAHKRLVETVTKEGETLLEQGNANKALSAFSEAKKFDPNADKIKDLELQARAKLSGSRRKKTIQIAFAVTVLSILFTAGWIFMHGGIEITAVPKESPILVYRLENKQIMKKITPDSTFGYFKARWLSRGQYLVSVNLPGYTLLEQKIDVGNGTTSQAKIVLEPELGRLSIESRPSGADIFIEDKLYGKTPLVIDSLLAIQHEITVKRKGYLTQRFPKTIKKDQMVKTDITLEPLQTFDRAKIFNRFRQDYSRNSNIKNSYEIFRKFVNGVEDTTLIHEIANFIDSKYNVIKLVELSEQASNFFIPHFLDTNRIIFAMDTQRTGQKGKREYFCYDFKNSSYSKLNMTDVFGHIYIKPPNAIVYTSDDELYEFDVSESVSKKITFGANLKGVYRLKFSTDFSRIVYTKGNDRGYSRIGLYDIKQQEVKNVAHRTNFRGDYNLNDPSFSIDGNSIFYIENQFGDRGYDVLYEYNIKSKSNRKVYTTNARLANLSVIPHSENSISLLIPEEDYKSSKIVIIDRTGTKLEEIYTNGANESFLTDTEDGKYLFYIRKYFGHQALWRYTIGQKNSETPITITENIFGYYSIAPNSNSIAFISKRTGNDALYFIDSKAKNSGNLRRRTLSRLDELVGSEICKSIVNEFIDDALIKGRYQMISHLLHSASNIHSNISNLNNWNDFLKDISKWRTDNPLVGAREIEIEGLYGGVHDDSAGIQARLYSRKGRSSYGIHIDFQLKKEDNKWKIFSAK